MLVQSLNATLNAGAGAQVRNNTFNVNGTVLDVHSGYTIGAIVAVPAAGPNSFFAQIDISSFFTVAFDATGVTLTVTPANMTGLITALPSLSSSFAILLSNDAGSTMSKSGIGVLSINPTSLLV
jgi:hypothetical protein